MAYNFCPSTQQFPDWNALHFSTLYEVSLAFCGVSNPPFLDTLSITSSLNCKLKSQLSQMPSLNGKLSPKPALSITNPKACAQIALLLALSEASAQIVTLLTASSLLTTINGQLFTASFIAPTLKCQRF